MKIKNIIFVNYVTKAGHYIVDEPIGGSTNKQVADREDACLDDYIRDDVLNEIDRIEKRHC